MSVKVLIVDDSGFFRRRLKEILDADPLIDVVGEANDGKQALEQVAALKPDVVTMDIEMPVMNGIEATREIMKKMPTSVLMFSSLSYEGAQATLDALEAGASDFLPKRFEDIANQREEAISLLRSRVRALGRDRPKPAPARPAAPVSTATASASAPAPTIRTPAAKPFKSSNFDLVAIGTSTGGPVALQAVLTALPATFSVPILMIQHMPPKFTEAFANRLDKICNISVREAQDGEKLEPGSALIAPGGMQLDVVKRGNDLVVKIKESSADQNYKPCVDDTYFSVATAVGRRALGIILTGMGQDGTEGARRMKQSGAEIWAQDEATSLIYGMPAAVAQANLADQILPLPEIGKKLTGN